MTASYHIAAERYLNDAKFHALVTWLIKANVSAKDIHHAFYAVQKIRADRFLLARQAPEADEPIIIDG